MTAENKNTPEINFLEHEKPHLLKEIEYLRGVIKEQEEIINQLASAKVYDYEYIHPFDVFELLQDRELMDFVEVVTVDKNPEDKGILVIDGQKYKESALIPARTKNIV